MLGNISNKQVHLACCKRTALCVFASLKHLLKNFALIGADESKSAQNMLVEKTENS